MAPSEPGNHFAVSDKTLDVLEQILETMQSSTVFNHWHDQAPDKMLNVLEQILKTMQKSTTFQVGPEDVPSKFWAEYHRVANEHDNALIERHGSNIEGLLIFAGLFSAVSSAFIIAMLPSSNMGPPSMLSTHDSLRLLIMHSMNDTAGFPDILSASTSATPPNTPPALIWIQSLAYAGLFASLLAAFGAVLAKQWLAHFKSSRWGRGSLEDRCRRRQAKFDGLQSWYFDAVLDTLPTLLHISFLLFGIALGANVWLQSHAIAAVIFGATALAGGFYVCTFVASFLSVDCPYQTPMAKVFRPIPALCKRAGMAIFQRLPQIKSIYDQIKNFGTRMLEVLKGAPGCALRKILSVRPGTTAWSLPLVVEMDLDALNESAIDRARKGLAIFKLGLPDAGVDASAPSTIRWILETSTDPNTITSAALMIPELEWPLGYPISAARIQLRNIMPRTLDCDFDWPEDNVYRICARAIVRLECIADSPAVSYDIWNVAFSDFLASYTPFASPAQWRNSLIEAASVLPFILDQPHAGKVWRDVAINVISKLMPMPDLPEQVLVDCLLCMSLLFGIRIVRRDLVKRDKRQAKADLAESVILLFQEALSNMTWDTSDYSYDFKNVSYYAGTALQLLVPLSHVPSHGILNEHPVKSVHFLLWILRLCFYLLRVQPSSDSAEAYAALQMCLSRGYTQACDGSQVCPWIDCSGLNLTSTETNFIVDYIDALLYGSDSDHDYAMLTAAFLVLRHGGAIEDLRKRTSYFNAIVHCMKPDKPAHVRFQALGAACSAVDDLVLVDDRIFQSRFLTVLYDVSFIDHRPPEWDATDSSLPYRDRDWRYLILLNGLVNSLSWRENIGWTGHLQRCLAIGQEASSHPILSNWGKFFYLRDTMDIFASVGLGSADSKLMSEISILNEGCWALMMRAWDIAALEYASDLNRLTFYEHLRPAVRFSMQCHWSRDTDRGALKGKIQMILDAFKNDLRPGSRPALSIRDQDGVRAVITELEELVALIESAAGLAIQT